MLRLTPRALTLFLRLGRSTPRSLLNLPIELKGGLKQKSRSSGPQPELGPHPHLHNSRRWTAKK